MTIRPTGGRCGRCSPGMLPTFGMARCTAASWQKAWSLCGFAIWAQIVWAKPRLVLSRGHYHWQHEPCLYAVRDGGKAKWQGARDQSTLWSIVPRGSEGGDPKTVHGTQKPVECMRRPILNNSTVGDAVFEPFSGSGTTIIAAEMTRRSCRAIELAPAYVDLAVRRWQAFTGQSAKLEGDGRTFDEVAVERLQKGGAHAGP